MIIRFVLLFLLCALTSSVGAFETQCARSGFDTDPLPFVIDAPAFTPKLIVVSGVIQVISIKSLPKSGLGISVLLFIDDRYVDFTEFFTTKTQKGQAFIVPFSFTHGIKTPGAVYTIDALRFGPHDPEAVILGVANLEVCFLGD